jgi:hypothetical protein
VPWIPGLEGTHKPCVLLSFIVVEHTVQALDVSTTIIHCRLGHVGMSSLEKMARHQSIMNLPASEVVSEALKSPDVCGACQEGRQKATNFPRTPISERTCVPYAKLHVDIAHMKTASAGRSDWFTVLVDEATGLKWIFTHRTKEESATCLREKIQTFIADGHRDGHRV